MKEEEALKKLELFLNQLPTGKVPADEQPEILELLQKCWYMFSGSTDTSMEAYKLERMIDLNWNPPVLSFEIARHGGTAMGSTRAEKHVWYMNLDTQKAKYSYAGYHQVKPRDAAFKAGPVAEELSELIIRGAKDERLKWSASGRACILTGKIISEDGPKRTLEGRRSRLLRDVETRLAPHGWKRYGQWWGRED